MIKFVVVAALLILALAILVRLVEARLAFFPSVGAPPPRFVLTRSVTIASTPRPAIR